VREYVLAAFQQYLRNQNMFTSGIRSATRSSRTSATTTYHPKATTVENCVFPVLGRGNWQTCGSSIVETLEWSNAPWELVSNEYLLGIESALQGARIRQE
jgi:putative DNA methylase